MVDPDIDRANLLRPLHGWLFIGDRVVEIWVELDDQPSLTEGSRSGVCQQSRRGCARQSSRRRVDLSS